MIIKPGIFLSIKCLLLTLVLLVSSKAALSQDEYYIPKALIIPVHTHKQELHLSLGKGGGYDANISYALSKHLAVFTTGTLNTGTLRRMSFSGDRYMIQKNDYAVKGGIGYFFTTDHKLMNHIESYAGYGSYKVDNYWYFPDERGKGGYETKAGFWNVFWQLQATHKIKRHELTAAVRLAYSRYRYLEYRDVRRSNDHVKTTLDGLWGMTIDPVISYSYLVKKFKFNVQYGASAALNPAVTMDETFYRKEGNQTIAIKPPGITKIRIGTFIGRLSIQYNFDFRRK